MYDLTHAIAFAAGVHEGQPDKGGAPYFWHVSRVAQNPLVMQFTDETAQIVAVLHDTIEDNKKYSRVALEQLIEEQFGQEVLYLVLLLTNEPPEDYLETYIPRIVKAGGIVAAVKMADLEDNMNILRQPTLRDKDLLRLQKYHIAYRMLRESL